MGYPNKTELEFGDTAWQYGWADLRAPGSGSRKRPSPDVMVIRESYTHPNGVYKKKTGTSVICAELKNNADGTARFHKREIAELDYWADRAGAKAFVGVKPDLRSFDQWFFVNIEDLHETDKGFSVRKQDHKDALSLKDVLGI